MLVTGDFCQKSTEFRFGFKETLDNYQKVRAKVTKK